MPFWKKKKPPTVEAPAIIPYQYEGLTEVNDFRLLELLPGGQSEPIRCRLRLASLAAQPLYSAVSYTWGNPPANRPILVNDLRFSVRTNLRNLLKDLRHPRHSQTYWVDAICINQDDNAEKSIQVQKMSSIYGNAVSVVAWLNDNSVPFDERLPLLRVSNALEEGFQAASQSKRKAIGAVFFGHNYWQRRWIIQEIALAKAVHICCGRLTVPLAHVESILQQQDLDGYNDSLAARLCRLQKSGTGQTSTLEKLLSDYASTGCKEYQDKVYALVSMSKFASEKFAISYEIDRLDLLLGTVEFSSTQEGLNPKKTIAFALMLSKQLGMALDELDPKTDRLYRGHTGLIYGSSLPPAVRSSLSKRGVVISTVIDATLFHEVQALREQCKEVRHLNVPMFIEQVDLVYCLRRGSVAAAFSWEPCEKWMISPRDLFVFIWQPDNSVDRETSQGVWIGFASARTETGDLMYRFPGTHMGILLRKVTVTAQFKVVGRARLAHVTSGLSFWLTEKYETPLQEEDQDLVICTEGWHTLDLMRLAHAEF